VAAVATYFIGEMERLFAAQLLLLAYRIDLFPGS
jgi:hypothetical protein